MYILCSFLDIGAFNFVFLIFNIFVFHLVIYVAMLPVCFFKFSFLISFMIFFGVWKFSFHMINFSVFFFIIFKFVVMFRKVKFIPCKIASQIYIWEIISSIILGSFYF